MIMKKTDSAIHPTIPHTGLKLLRQQQQIPPQQQQLSIPIHLYELENLTHIGLCSRGLIALTPAIAHLKKAHVLQVCCNALTSIPPHLGLLSNLTVLSLARNQLTDLPLALSRLTALVDLDLSHNLLTHVPACVPLMSQLQHLSLRENPLTTLPALLSRLTHLVCLDASHTQLRTVPAELARLKHLRQLKLRHCPLLSSSTTASQPSQQHQQQQQQPSAARDSTVHTPALYTQTHPAVDPPPLQPHTLPTLCELSARTLVDGHMPVRLPRLPPRLQRRLLAHHTCTFCGLAFLQHHHTRYTCLQKHHVWVPFEHRLCRPHWHTEPQRIQALFSTPQQHQQPTTAVGAGSCAKESSPVRHSVHWWKLRACKIEVAAEMEMYAE